MHKKSKTHKFNYSDKNSIAELSQSLKDIEIKCPIVFDFLESYCGYNAPMNTSEPYAISYSQGKRDVILMIKTLMRDDISPDSIAQYYKII